jgi:hypothetical protein
MLNYKPSPIQSNAVSKGMLAQWSIESRENTIMHPIKYMHTIEHTQMPIGDASPTVFNQIVP